MKEKEQDPLDPQCVFKIKNSEITHRVTQCPMADHQWKILNDSEIRCIKCPTILIVGKGNAKKYAK